MSPAQAWCRAAGGVHGGAPVLLLPAGAGTVRFLLVPAAGWWSSGQGRAGARAACVLSVQLEQVLPPSVLLSNHVDINCHPVVLTSVCLGVLCLVSFQEVAGCSADFRVISAWWHCEMPQNRELRSLSELCTRFLPAPRVFFLRALVGLSSSVQLLLPGFTETQPGGSLMPRPLPQRGWVQLVLRLCKGGAC